jgi:hypothetical protein
MTTNCMRKLQTFGQGCGAAAFSGVGQQGSVAAGSLLLLVLSLTDEAATANSLVDGCPISAPIVALTAGLGRDVA